MMENPLIPIVKDIITRNKIRMSLSEENTSNFWLDDSSGSLTVKFRTNMPSHEILYDVFSPEFSMHLKEETIKDVECLDFIAEEHQKWNIPSVIEDIWLILDHLKLWAHDHGFSLRETKLF